MAPENLRYTQTHEWCAEQKGIITIGVTEHGVSTVGQIIYIDLPENGADVLHEVPVGELEGLDNKKTLLSPFDGVIVEINERAVYDPGLVTETPYEKGWLIRLKPLKPAPMKDLLSANEYEQMIRKRR